MATQHYNLSEVLRQLGDLAGARSQLERALEIGQATLGPTTPTSPTIDATSTALCSRLRNSAASWWLG
jgi:Tetratricopeptide repeat